MRHCLGYVFNKLGLAEIPEFLRDELIQSIQDMRIENPDL